MLCIGPNDQAFRRVSFVFEGADRTLSDGALSAAGQVFP